MSFCWIIGNEFDLFYFSNEKSSNQISTSSPLKIERMIEFFCTSLNQLKPIVILKKKIEIDLQQMNELKSKHYLINPDQYIFLNITLKKKLKGLIRKDVMVNNFQELETFFSSELDKIFQ